MTKRTHWALIAASLYGAPLSGCLEDETLRTNIAPVANAGEDQQLPYDGAPVRVRLDGRGSSDRDGEIVEYIWRSAQQDADGGVQWAEGALDPDDVARPMLELERGRYTFVLWVKDNDGAVSEPDSVTINIGTDPIAQCVADSLDLVPEACLACSCGGGEACLAATVGCREDCWGLIRCIVQMGCATGDTACIIANCGPFLGGATAATAVGPCVTPCAAACGEGGGGSDAGS
jgi:hypothetical protein